MSLPSSNNIMLTECARHCLHCISFEYCTKCDDDFMPVAGGCTLLCKESAHYYSPYATQCLGNNNTPVTMAMYLLLPC